MRLVTAVLSILLLSLALWADDFDLNHNPKSKEESQKITEKMLKSGTEIAYRKDHPNQKLWIFRPTHLKKGDLRPCVFFIHGGGWGGSPESLAPQCIYLQQRGVVTVSIHFRRPGPSPKDCLADSLSAYRWIKKNAKEYGIDPDRIVVSGGSAGGHLALAMVTIPGCDHPDDDKSIPIDPKALILFNPAIDLVDGWAGGQAKCRKGGVDPAEFSPAHKVKEGLPETLILSGEKDQVITPDMLKAFRKRMKEHGNKCTVILDPEGTHGWFNYGKGDGTAFHKTMAEVEKFLAKLGYLEATRKDEPAGKPEPPATG